MLLYSWTKILKSAGVSSKRVVLILESMIQTRMPKNRYDPLYKYYYMDFSGNSFLLDPYSLIQYRYKWKDKEIADYIGLASFRNTGEYLASRKTTLDLSHTNMSKDAINNNRLLRIEGNDIHFLYEDYKKEKIKWQD